MAQRIEGRRFTRIEIAWPNSIVSPRSDAEAFVDMVIGPRIGKIGRRGKYLILPLIDHCAKRFMLLHMGMTGSLHVRSGAEPELRHTRTIFWMDDSRRIELNDPRKWAKLWMSYDSDAVLSRLGPEPKDISEEEFAARVARRRSRIKSLLLDQSLIAGVGNIYADEALHRAGISPLRRSNRISRNRLQELHSAIIETLDHAVRFIALHPSPDGSPYVVNAYDGRMRLSRNDVGRCPVCAAQIKRRRINGRTAFYCISCQR